MLWHREESDIDQDPRVIELEERTSGRGWSVLSRAKAFVSRTESDGVIPLSFLRTLIRHGSWKVIVRALVELGFLRECQGPLGASFEIVGHLEKNPSSAKAKAEREAADRRRARSAGRGPQEGDGSPDATGDGSAIGSPSTTPIGSAIGSAIGSPSGSVSGSASQQGTSDMEQIQNPPPREGEILEGSGGNAGAEARETPDATGDGSAIGSPSEPLSAVLVEHAARAYVDGLARGGHKRSVPTGKELEHLRRALETHGEGEGRALVAWARTAGEAYARAAVLERRSDQKGFATFKFLDWLDNGRTFDRGRGRDAPLERQPAGEYVQQLLEESGLA